MPTLPYKTGVNNDDLKGATNENMEQDSCHWECISVINPAYQVVTNYYCCFLLQSL